MTRRTRLIAAIAGSFIGLPIILVGYLSYTRFYRYQAKVDRFLRAIPASDRNISRDARDVFEKLDGNAMTWIATKCLLRQVAPQQVRMSEWHLRGIIWQTLLPLRLEHEDILAVYTHCMYSREAVGISAITTAMYGKPASELTAFEAIGIVAIGRQPGASPAGNPELFRANVQRLTQQYGGAD